MKQFVNILLLAMVGAGALNAYQFKFDNKSAVVITYGNGQQLTMNNLWTLEFADVLPATKKKNLTDEHFRLAAGAGAKSDSVPLWIIRRCETLEQIRAQCVMRKLDVVFIDYVQLIDAPGRERWDIVTNISMALHRMAQSLGITVVGLSQITPAQKGGKQAPTKDDLRESRQLKQDADVIMILSPSSDDEDPEDTRVLQVAKNKDGRCGRIRLRFEPQYMSFSQLVTLSGLYSEGRAAKNSRTAKAPEPSGEEDLPF